MLALNRSVHQTSILKFAICSLKVKNINEHQTDGQISDGQAWNLNRLIKSEIRSNSSLGPFDCYIHPYAFKRSPFSCGVGRMALKNDSKYKSNYCWATWSYQVRNFCKKKKLLNERNFDKVVLLLTSQRQQCWVHYCWLTTFIKVAIIVWSKQLSSILWGN